jgi:glycosyltransferase involved in cell wall biosynthesis
MVLLDAFWYFGGNRSRGIGRYLEYYFSKVCDIPREERLWLIPEAVPDREVNTLLSLVGGRSQMIDLHQSKPRQRELLCRWVEEKEISKVFISSPFERPWSLLDFISVFVERSIPTQALVFDLLPLQFPEHILSTWSEEDRERYDRRVRRLRQVDKLFAISPATKAMLRHYLLAPIPPIEVVTFGLKDTWLTPPKEVDLNWWREVRTGKYVMTISGGEWRKNLEGTIRYFAKHFARSKYTLLVICRLGRREKLSFQWLAWRLGVLSRVVFLGEVDERTKWRLLAQSEVFLFLSRGEGLGIPLLEARKAKVPRIIISEELAQVGLDELVPGAEIAKSN